MRLLSSAYAAVAVSLLVAGCAAPDTSAPGGSASPPSAASAGRTKVLTVTAILAPFTLPAAVSRPIVYPAGAGLLVVGGLTSADTTTRAIQRVDLTSGTVTQAGQLPVGVHDAGGAVVNGRDLLFGGGSTALTSAVQDVTPGSTARLISHLPQPRADLVAASDAAAGYVLAGFDGSQGLTTVLRTVDGVRFTVAGALPVSVRYPAVAVSGRFIWLFGGEHSGQQVSDVQRVDLATGHGSLVAHLPHPLAHAGAFTLGGVVFVAGGRSGSGATDIVMGFDPATGRFTAAGRLPGARSDFGVAVVSGSAYLVGGENPRPVDTVVKVHTRESATP